MPPDDQNPSALKYQQCFLQDLSTGRMHCTRTGVSVLGSEFAQVGYNVRHIHTWSVLEAAIDARFVKQMRDVALTTRGQSPLLDQILAGLPGWEDVPKDSPAPEPQPPPTLTLVHPAVATPSTTADPSSTATPQPPDPCKRS